MTLWKTKAICPSTRDNVGRCLGTLPYNSRSSSLKKEGFLLARNISMMTSWHIDHPISPYMSAVLSYLRGFAGCPRRIRGRPSSSSDPAEVVVFPRPVESTNEAARLAISRTRWVCDAAHVSSLLLVEGAVPATIDCKPGRESPLSISIPFQSVYPGCKRSRLLLPLGQGQRKLTHNMIG